MRNRAQGTWINLSQSLGFIPGAIVAFFAGVGIVLVEVDSGIDLRGVAIVFQGDASAARTVLSVIAGSLITVAGLTFSITMVVLQLASSQFSPRILRTFFGDRITQLTIGTFVGTFVYAILVLRVVGAGFVPRLSVTVASLLGIAAVILLIVFLNHVSRLVQVSHLTASVAHDTLARTELLYPEPYGEPAEDERASELLRSWRSDSPGCVLPARPGYVQRVAVDALATALAGRAGRAAVLVSPGDFVSVETPILEVWPAEAAESCRRKLLGAVAIASERDLHQDVEFGLRQLADIALKAISPGINDPATAVTCIGYLRSILVRLTERRELAGVRRFPDRDLVVIVHQRPYSNHFDSLLQINRYVAGDAWVAGEMLEALVACARTARRCGAVERVDVVRAVAVTIAEHALDEMSIGRDVERIDGLRAEIDAIVAS